MSTASGGVGARHKIHRTKEKMKTGYGASPWIVIDMKQDYIMLGINVYMAISSPFDLFVTQDNPISLKGLYF